jgi:TetR/AcrR family tetracycline transcriptional repressor
VPLGRDEVVKGALALLDEEGLDALTMRRLAKTLGVQAGAIYWHFADKQALIDAMVEQMLGGLVEPPPEGSWQEQLGELSRRMAAALLAHRDGARLATLALRPGPNGLGLSEAMMAIIRRGVRTSRAALWAGAVIGYYVLGYVVDVQATEAAKARGLVSVVRAFRKKLDKKQFPQLHAISDGTMEEMMLTGRSAQSRFEFGLGVILRGLGEAPPPATPKRRPRRASRPPRRRS